MLLGTGVEKVSGIWILSFGLLPIISSSCMPYPLTNYKTPSPGLFILCVHLVYAYMPHVCLCATYVHCLQKQGDIRSSGTELHVIELTSVGADSKTCLQRVLVPPEPSSNLYSAFVVYQILC